MHQSPQGSSSTTTSAPISGNSKQTDQSVSSELGQLNQPLWLSRITGSILNDGSQPNAVFVPAISPADLGDPGFRQTHGLRYNLMTGAMANGIASAELVIAAAKAGCLGSYGAGGQSLEAIETAIDTIQAALTQGEAYCANLIHSPGEPQHEESVAQLLVRKGVHLIEASAYLGLTAAVVWYRVNGLKKQADGSVHIPHRIIAKASRVEVATRWLSPPPVKILDQLLAAGRISQDEYQLAGSIPMADDLTAEADSGGHTDNRPALCMLPTFLALRDRLQEEHHFPQKVRVGLGGGIASPLSASAAFAMGAAYIVTGTINQACIEAGSCEAVRKMLAEADQADVIMAPAADMFEMGVKLQVLKRGTMFAMRGQRLFDTYQRHASWAEVPAADRGQIEKQILQSSFEDIWAGCVEFWQRREPRQLQKAQQDPKHQMALVFRWYLGMASRWANSGDPKRRMDYQVWCGPAMGAFNEWTKDTPLAHPEARQVGPVSHHLLYGAAYHTRLAIAANQGLQLNLPGYRPVGPDPLN